MNIIIDYKSGNICSLSNALDRVGAEYTISSDAAEIAAADRVLFPGQGHISQVTESLEQLGLKETIKQIKKPFLGICVGMQLLYEESEEGETPGLGIIAGKVQRLSQEIGLKIPQVGWNTLKITQEDPLFKGIPDQSYFYYANSYVASIGERTLAKSEYGQSFSAVCRYNNFYGVQFHPEKSGDAGLQLLKNFLSL